MSSARAKANQALYLSKIVLQCWREKLAEQATPARTLNEAFLPAVTMHLKAAYGWFLLELADAEPPVDGIPPGDSQGLPAIPRGRAESGELLEIRQLERSGFLAQMLAAAAATHPGQTGVRRGEGGLVVRTSEGPGVEDVTRWVADIEQMCDRMRNSLDEC